MAKKITKNLLSDIFDAENLSETRIEIFGKRKAVFEGCYGIREYSTEFVKIGLSRGTIDILGTDLILDYMQEKSVSVSGNIMEIHFEGDIR